MLKTSLKILTLVAVIAYLVFALTTLNRPAEQTSCTGLDISITDTGFIDESEVRQLLIEKSLFPEGKNSQDISLAELESCLVASQYISHALCYMRPDGVVTIQVTPRRPILHVINNAGEDFYIDNCGTTMPRAGHTADLIVMTGNVPRAEAAALYAPLGETLMADSFWSRNIEEVHVTADGELQLTPRLGNHIIILGDTSDVAAKLQRLTIFYDNALSTAGWNRYKTISLKYDNQIVCTKWE